MSKRLVKYKRGKGWYTLIPKDMAEEEAADALTQLIFEDSSDPNVFTPKDSINGK